MHPTQLDVLVYAMGRVNFGVEVHDRKGIHGPVLVEGDGKAAEELKGWKIFPLPLDADMLSHLAYSTQSQPSGAAFFRGEFEAAEIGDTFLDLTSWGMGAVWVNGHCLGRYWNIGPQQTMYLPGVWLKEGRNEVIVFDLIGPEKQVLSSRTTPVVDLLRPELDFSGPAREPVQLSLSPESANLLQYGKMLPGDQITRIEFDKVAKGRYVCLESIDAYGDKPFAGAAEIDLLDKTGGELSHNEWKVVSVDSEERIGEDGSAENAIDGQTVNYWHTEWKMRQPNHPHHIVIDLGKTQELSALIYVPRAGEDINTSGRIKAFRIFVGDNLVK
jgi:beta-galactosidase